MHSNLIGQLPENIAINGYASSLPISAMLSTWTPFDCVAIVSIDNGYGGDVKVRITNKANTDTMVFRAAIYVPRNHISLK